MPTIRGLHRRNSLNCRLPPGVTIAALPRAAMDFDDAVRLVRAHVESKFPKTCNQCGRVFLNLPDYIRSTRHVGASPHQDGGRWKMTVDGVELTRK
jgi:hypothetical protein